MRGHGLLQKGQQLRQFTQADAIADAQLAELQEQAKADAVAKRQSDDESRQQQYHDAFAQQQAVEEQRAERAQSEEAQAQADRQEQRRAAFQALLNFQSAQQQQAQVRAAATQIPQTTTTNCQTRVVTAGVASTNCATN